MSWIAKLKMLSKFPPGVLYHKALNKLKTRKEHERYLKHILPVDPRVPSTDPTRPPIEIASDFFRIKELDFSGIDAGTAHWLLERYREKRFDLLGSGWVYNRYDSEAYGLEGHRFANSLKLKPEPKGNWIENVVAPAHVPFSRELWTWIQDLDPNYVPIDWQRDFKSGFRWDAKLDYSRQRKLMEGQIGIDLKVPWELSRLQHLPQMAVLSESLDIRKEFAVEYLCQTLDFILANPIGMGVNFNCPMDIGIRVANMLLAFDLFQDRLDAQVLVRFKPILATYILESCRHIAQDMEYREGLTSNHYLGNVLGILFGAAYLNQGVLQDQFLAYGIQELQRSMDRQFFNDGSNFEGSTSYHRLSGEMMALGLALVLRFGPEHRDRLKCYTNSDWNFAGPLFPATEQVFNAGSAAILPRSFFEKLAKSAQFSKDIAKPMGTIPQFGDNDSGRFFRLTPTGRFRSKNEAQDSFEHLPAEYWNSMEFDSFWEEDALDHTPFTALVDGIFEKNGASTCSLEYAVGSGAINSSELRPYPVSIGLPESFAKESSVELPYTSTHMIPLWDSLPAALKRFYYPDFQLLGIKGDEFYVALVGMSNPEQHHSLSHVHNDKLHVELEFAGQSLLRDPGTYLYTPIPKWRVDFRSVFAHNTAITGDQEQNRPLEGRLGLFNMMHDVRFTAETFSDTALGGIIRYRDIVHRRKVELTNSGITITDSCNKPFMVNFEPFEFYSPGYGKRLRVRN
ncbi:MAG: heparinase II/III family protein [Flavobacteriales bacterium]|nr:heparinase II/III family protein [Flavobacteriales bacterium]